jgi:TPR repeat protein
MITRIVAVALLFAAAVPANAETGLGRDCRASAAPQFEGGVTFAELAPNAAIDVCEKALAETPGDLTLLAFYARALGKVGRSADALQAAKLSAEGGNPIGQTVLANLYSGSGLSNAVGIARDYGEALKWLRAGADQGYAWAQNNLGAMYFSGQGVTKNQAEGARWYGLAAQQGFSLAELALAKAYENGNGVKEDDSKAVQFYRLAAEHGEIEAQMTLATSYEYGSLGLNKSVVEAVDWYKRAAAQGNRAAQKKLWEISPDLTEVASWYRSEADRGKVYAQINLGWAYGMGRGVPQDDAEAAKWYRLAAERGENRAQVTLARIYEVGEGVDQSIAEAIHWYKLAAERGDGDALASLGDIYFYGRGVPQDDAEAARWYQLAEKAFTSRK